MKVIQNKQNILLLHLTLLIAMLYSCANQNQSNFDIKQIGISKNAGSVESKIDTTLQLKFTTAVRSIFEDSKGNFWFGSWKEGVCRYDGKSFTYFTEKEGLSNNQVRTIQEDQTGNIWFATSSGISSYDGEKIIIRANADELTSAKNLETEWQKEANDLWFNIEIDGNGKVAKGICKYDNRQIKYLAFPSQVLESGLFKENGTITGISRGKNDRLWFASYAGVFGYDGKSFYLINEKDFSFHVRSIFEDSNGNLWIGNNGIGVLLFDGKTTINFTEKFELKNSDYERIKNASDKPGTLTRVFSIGEDKAGNIWFGTFDAGAWKYDGKTLTNYTTANGLTSMSIMEIYMDKKNVLWFGMGDGSVCQFNGTSFDKIY